MSIPRICYYHAGCSDGFGAAWAIHHWLGDTYDYRPLQYGATLDPAEHAGAEVLFVDVTLKADDMQALAEHAWSVTVLDHHISAVRDLQPLLDAGIIDGVLDTTRSGAILAWRWAAAQQPGRRPLPDSPMLLRYIEDRDLWVKQMNHCDEVAMWLRSHPMDFARWDTLMEQMDHAPGSVFNEARAISRYHNRIVEQLVDRHRVVTIDGCDIAVVNCPGAFVSDVAGRLAEVHVYAIAYFDTDDKRVYSLRSDPSGPDVSRIAERHGGGGHPHAAGYTRPLSEVLGKDGLP